MKKNLVNLRSYLSKVWSSRVSKTMKLTNLLLFAAVFNVFGQRAITGTVRDDSGNTLPGVNVVVTGTTVGAMTDIDGQYRLSVPAGSTTLTFSFIGMETQVVTIGNQATINVTMQSDAIGLEEIIVVGYGTTVKSSVTGSISSVGGAEIQAFAASTNIVDALSANISGAFVVAQGGDPGALSNIYLRGPVSVNGGNETNYS